MKALGLAIPAIAKKNQDIIRYFNSFLSIHLIFFMSHMLRINKKPDNIANIVKAITPRSVLLSTNTKNAHIQLVNHINKVDHHNIRDVSFAV